MPRSGWYRKFSRGVFVFVQRDFQCLFSGTLVLVERNETKRNEILWISKNEMTKLKKKPSYSLSIYLKPLLSCSIIFYVLVLYFKIAVDVYRHSSTYRPIIKNTFIHFPSIWRDSNCSSFSTTHKSRPSYFPGEWGLEQGRGTGGGIDRDNANVVNTSNSKLNKSRTFNAKYMRGCRVFRKRHDLNKE